MHLKGLINMAKKAKTSARSKGFRKHPQKKPFLTKKELIWLAVIVAVIVLGFVLFKLLYNDGSLPVKDGVVVTETEDDIIINAAKNGKRYFKLGEVGQIEGFVRTNEPIYSDTNITTYYFRPDDENSPLDYYQIYGSSVETTELIRNNSRSIGATGAESISGTVPYNDGEVYFYSYISTYPDPKDNTKTEYYQSFTAYIPVKGERTIIVRIVVVSNDEADMLDEETQKQLIVPALNAVRPEIEEKK